MKHVEEDQLLHILSKGPNRKVACYKKYIIDGFRFSMQSEDKK